MRQAGRLYAQACSPPADGDESMKGFVEVSNIVKTYPGVRALKEVSVSFEKGDVHAIIGENGAGKSTLMKILAGASAPDGGAIVIDGRKYRALTPKESIDLGIQVIYQELNQISNMSVMDNIFIGMPPRRGILVDFKEMERRTQEILKTLHMESIDPHATVSSLTAGYQQMVEIAKALTRNVRLLILDEPTSALSANEADILFSIIRHLKARGVTILFISHRLDEIFRIADRVTVMRDGEVVATRDVDKIMRSEMINLMVGRDFKEVFPASKAKRGEVALELKDVSGAGFHNVSLYVRKGEILGLAGLVGSGRTETMMGVYGATKIHEGEVILGGKAHRMKSPEDSIAKGLALLPEDRKEQGLILSLPVKNNIDLPSLRRISRYSVIDRMADKKLVEEGIANLNIKTPGMYQQVLHLSGGNQQKVVVAKWLAAKSDILVFDEPTKGIDVSAKQEIYSLLCSLAEQGKAIVLISSDMEEVIGMSDRMYVFYEGTVQGELSSKEEFDKNRIMELASGMD